MRLKMSMILTVSCLLQSALATRGQQVIPKVDDRWDYAYLSDSRVEKRSNMPLGPFVRLTDHELLAASPYGETKDNLLYSSDNGKTWSIRRIIENPKSVVNGNAQVIARNDNGVVIVGFTNSLERKWTWADSLQDAPGATNPTYVVKSVDNGKSWEKPVKLHDEWTGYNVNMIVTSKGNFVFTSMMMLNNPGRHAVITYTSRDEGETWERSNVIDIGGVGNHDGAMEATIVELKTGSLLMLIRTNWNQFWRAESKDDGLTWHIMGSSGIPASAAHGQLLRLESGRLLLAWNRPYGDGESEPRMVVGGDNFWSAVPGSNYRNELSVALSEDDGKSWSNPIVVAKTEETGMRSIDRLSVYGEYIPKNEISYPYLFEFAPGEIWITSKRGPLRASFRENDLLWK